MPEYKKQHYVPQFYFRFFSMDGHKINQFNLDNERVDFIPIGKVCQKSYFYSKDPELEKSFSDLEAEHNRVIKNVIQTHHFPRTILDNYYLLNFIAFQPQRTLKNKERVDQMTDTIVKKAISSDISLIQKGITEEVLKSVKISHKGMFLYSVLSSFFSDILILDLKQVLLINESSDDFIFSDNPVICYNLVFHKEKTGFKGLQSPGIIVFCPLDSRHVIVLYDSVFYEFLPANSDRITIHDRNDVKAINALQYFNCFNNVYYANNQQQQQIVNMYMEFKNSIGYRKKIFAQINNFVLRTVNNTEEMDVLRFSTYSMNYNLSTSFIKINKPLPKNIPYQRDLDLVNLFKKTLKEYISAMD